MEFPYENFEGEIEGIRGQKLKYLKVLVSDKVPYPDIGVFWMQTGDGVWHRFFTDAWMLHWSEFQEEAAQECIEEDLEEGEFDGNLWEVRDLLSEYNLMDKMIKDLEAKYINRDTDLCAQFIIKIEDDVEIVLNDFDDRIDSELLVIKFLK